MRLNLAKRVSTSQLVYNLERIIGIGYPAIEQISGSIGPNSECPIILGVKGLPGEPEVRYAVIVHDAPDRHSPLQGHASQFDILVGERTAEIVDKLIGVYK